MSCTLPAKIGAVWLTHKYVPWDFYYTKISVIYIFFFGSRRDKRASFQSCSELQGEIKAPAEWAGFRQSRQLKVKNLWGKKARSKQHLNF